MFQRCRRGLVILKRKFWLSGGLVIEDGWDASALANGVGDLLADYKQFKTKALQVGRQNSFDDIAGRLSHYLRGIESE